MILLLYLFYLIFINLNLLFHLLLFSLFLSLDHYQKVKIHIIKKT